jgi:hypothetical protein
VDGCEEPAPRARPGPRVAGPRASAASPAALVPAGAGREGAELCGAYVKAAPRRRRRGGAGGRDPHPAVLKCVYARPATLYVYVLLRFYITTVAISRGRTLSWGRSIDLCPCRRQPTRKCGSHKRKPRQPCARRDGADAPPCTPPIAFPAGAAAAPRVRVCCAS